MIELTKEDRCSDGKNEGERRHFDSETENNRYSAGVFAALPQPSKQQHKTYDLLKPI